MVAVWPRSRGLGRLSLETLPRREAPFFGALQGEVAGIADLIRICFFFLLLFVFCVYVVGWWSVSGTGGRVGMRLICGIRTAGMSHKTKREGKVDEKEYHHHHLLGFIF